MTPGVAGAITMTISNTMWMQFGLQQRWCALALSFAFGALVFAATRIPLWQRAVYYVLNSLIIFPPDDTASNLDPGNREAAGFPQFGHGRIKLSVLFNEPADLE